MEEIENLKKFGSKLKEIREQRNLTQAELAEKVGLSTNFIGMVERAERNTIISNLFKLSKALNVSPSDFFDYNVE